MVGQKLGLGLGFGVILALLLVVAFIDNCDAFTTSSSSSSSSRYTMIKENVNVNVKPLFSTTAVGVESSPSSPFDPETITHLNSLIGTLSNVLKNKKKPTAQEMRYFQSSMNLVLNEARSNSAGPAAPSRIPEQPKVQQVKDTTSTDDYGVSLSRFKADRFDGVLKELEHPRDNPNLQNSKAFEIDPSLLGENVPRTKAGTPATTALRSEGTKLHQPLGKIQTNTWGTDPFAGFNFDGADDEEDAVTKRNRERRKGDIPGVNRPAKSWGQRKYQDSNVKPTGYDSRIHGDREESRSTTLRDLSHPAIVGTDNEFLDAFSYDPDTLGEGVPKTKLGTPATRQLIADGQKTHQKLGKIQTNTWGTEPFAGYDDKFWNDDEAGCD